MNKLSADLLRKRSGRVLLIAAFCVATLCFFSPVLGPAWFTSSNFICSTQDNAFGIIMGDSIDSLQPIDLLGIQGVAAWPIANPIFTSSSMRTFDGIASPHLLVHKGRLLMFFESASCLNSRRAIGVAESVDEGASWHIIGTVLTSHREDALRRPHVFEFNNEMFMVTDSADGPTLYRATSFPQGWHFNKTLVPHQLRNPSVLYHPRTYKWLLTGSVPSKRRMTHATGTTIPPPQDDALALYVANSPLGPWVKLKNSPFRVHAGSPGGGLSSIVDEHGGGGVALVRMGRTCHRGRCSQVQASIFNFTGSTLSEAPLEGFLGDRIWNQSSSWDRKGRGYTSAVRLPSRRVVAIVEGLEPGKEDPPKVAAAVDAALYLSTMVAVLSVMVVAAHAVSRLRSVRSAVLRWDIHQSGGVVATPKPSTGQRPSLWDAADERGSESSTPESARSASVSRRGSSSLASNLAGRFSPGVGQASPSILFANEDLSSPSAMKQGEPRRRQPAATNLRRLVARLYETPARRVLAAIFIASVATGVALALQRARHIASPFWQPAPPEAVAGQYSRFTLMVMTYGDRRKLLGWYIRHYSTCASVGEILIVWNGGDPPDPTTDFSFSSVPIRLRQELVNSMNNRYRVDDSLRYRAVLSLDDDILLPCSDVEKAFASWRERPELITGWYPRLAQVYVARDDGAWAKRTLYLGEPAAIAQGKYNLVLTGGAFFDTRTALPYYWSPALAEARSLVDKLRNCDDLLMNFVVANVTLGGRHIGDGNKTALPQAVQYVRPTRRVDLSHLSGVGLSHAVQHFVDDAEQCLDTFSKIFGGLILRSEAFSWSGLSPPKCSGGDILQCSYLD